jgi:tetratricopeptide (TPR) repeat protein
MRRGKRDQALQCGIWVVDRIAGFHQGFSPQVLFRQLTGSSFESVESMVLGWFRKGATSQAAKDADPVQAPLDARALDAEIRATESDLAQGEVAAAEARVESLLRTNPTDPRVLVNLGACLYLGGNYDGASEALVATINLEPDNLRAHFLLAANLGAQGDHATALQVANKALSISPRDMDLLLMAANSCVQIGEYESGAQLLNRAIEIQPDAIAPHHRLESLSQHSTYRRSNYEFSPKVGEARRRVINRLLAAHRRKGLDAEQLTALLSLLETSTETIGTAARLAKSEVDRKPMPPVLADQLASIFWTVGDAKELLRLRELCFDADPQNQYFKLALSHAWLINGFENWNEAWRFMTATLHQTRPKLHPDQVPLWEGQRLGKRKVLVYQDQGMGDAIMAFRFLAKLAARGVRFDLWVFPRLADLAAQTTGYETLIRTPSLPDPRNHGCDFAVPLFGLIAALDLGPGDLADPPVVRARPDRAVAARAEIASLPGLRVGLIYGGNPNRRDDWERSIPTKDICTLAAVQGISWVNLMVDERPDREEVTSALRMLDPTASMTDFADTTAIVDALDAVVAVDSSVAHVAGNLAKPTWVLVPSSCDWRWQMGVVQSPWWPTATLMRSEQPGVWKHAMESLVRELETFASGNARPVTPGGNSQ